MAKITYGQLDKALRALGFSVKVQDEAMLYGHGPSGALVAIPQFPPGEEVMPHHLITTRTILDDFRIADPLAFDEKLRQAG
jgi:hypothetical protein